MNDIFLRTLLLEKTSIPLINIFFPLFIIFVIHFSNVVLPTPLSPPLLIGTYFYFPYFGYSFLSLIPASTCNLGIFTLLFILTKLIVIFILKPNFFTKIIIIPKYYVIILSIIKQLREVYP